MRVRTPRRRPLGYALALFLTALWLPATAAADGTETLGPPSIPIAQGTSAVIGGVGLDDGDATISLTVPSGVTIQQVLVYWSGEFSGSPDDTLVVAGTEVTGTSIGGPTNFFSDIFVETFRADITGLGVVAPGPNSVDVGGLTFDRATSGAGILVIIDDGSSPFATIDVRDGSDLAFVNFAPPLDTTVPQVYVVPASTSDRTAELLVFAGSVGGADRPNAITVDVDGDVTTFTNALGSFAGNFWDAVALPVFIPAGATTVTVQALSQDDGSGNLPASFNWILATLDVPGEDIPGIACRMTGGGANVDGTWDGNMGSGLSDRNFYTFGGQIGAPTARQPQPFGEWTHTQHRGPDGQFTFHMGTASAPPGTEVDVVTCSDEGFCQPARPAPAKQLDWEGIGAFKNVIDPTSATAGVVPGETLHYAHGHVEDLGEPGRAGRFANPGPECPPDGNAGLVASCGCPDFYRLEIHATTDPTSPVIYSVDGYIRSGNIQIHPEIQ